MCRLNLRIHGFGGFVKCANALDTAEHFSFPEDWKLFTDPLPRGSFPRLLLPYLADPKEPHSAVIVSPRAAATPPPPPPAKPARQPAATAQGRLFE